jgi:Ca2+/Na+ antiporter
LGNITGSSVTNIILIVGIVLIMFEHNIILRNPLKSTISVWAGRDESGISDGSQLEFLVSVMNSLTQNPYGIWY